MNQERMDSHSQNAPRAGGVEAYSAPDIDATLSKATQATKRVRVVHGANEKYFDSLEGKTVGNVRKSLRDAFNIPGDAVALIDGQEAKDDEILAGGATLEFFKESGVKG